MTHIDYANPSAQRPGLAPVVPTEAERETATKNRYWAIVPFGITFTVNVFFLLQYWLPEAAGFPHAGWWMDQLAPLASPFLTSRGEPQVPIQADSGFAPFVLLVMSIALVYFSRTRNWWGRIGILIPASIGMLAGLGIMVRLLSTGGNRTSGLSVMALLLYLIAIGYVAAAGYQDRLGAPPPKNWHSGLPMLVGYAMISPVPTAVGRWLFAPELRDVAAGLQGNRGGLRLSALFTGATPLLWFCGVCVGIAIWVVYRWWPLRPGTQVMGLLVGVMITVVVTALFAIQASGLAAVRTTQLRLMSPAPTEGFSCGAFVTTPTDRTQPAQTVAITGSGCSTVVSYLGYREVSQPHNVGVSLSPIAATIPGGKEIGGDTTTQDAVGARYGDILVLVFSDQVDRTPSGLVGLRIPDLAQVWVAQPCPEPFSLRFAKVPSGDNPQLGYVTESETKPAVVTSCAGKTQRLDPATGK